MIIDSSYFVGENNIPNTGHADVVGTVNNLIETYEKEYLQNILGYELFKLYTAAIAEPMPAPKWIAIRDGKEYTALDGRLYQWKGLKNATFESPVADYVFYKWLKKTHSQVTGNGVVKTDNENSSAYSPARKMSDVWNAMVEKNWKIYNLLVADPINYPQFIQYGACRHQRYLLTRINPWF